MGLSKVYLMYISHLCNWCFSPMKHEVLALMISFYWYASPSNEFLFSICINTWTCSFTHTSHAARTSNICNWGKNIPSNLCTSPSLQLPKERHLSFKDIVLSQSYLEQFLFLKHNIYIRINGDFIVFLPKHTLHWKLQGFFWNFP